MIFPEDIWILVKNFLMEPPSGILWERVRRYRSYGLRMQYHLYYHLLKTKRELVISNMLRYYSISHQKLALIRLRAITHERYFNMMNIVDPEDSVWDRIATDQEDALNSIKVIRITNDFFNISETASTKKLLEVFFKATEAGDLLYIDDCYSSIICSLKSRRESRFFYQPLNPLF